MPSEAKSALSFRMSLFGRVRRLLSVCFPFTGWRTTAQAHDASCGP